MGDQAEVALTPDLLAMVDEGAISLADARSLNPPRGPVTSGGSLAALAAGATSPAVERIRQRSAQERQRSVRARSEASMEAQRQAAMDAECRSLRAAAGAGSAADPSSAALDSSTASRLHGLSALSAKALKQLLRRAGVDPSTCLEKRELVELALASGVSPTGAGTGAGTGVGPERGSMGAVGGGALPESQPRRASPAHGGGLRVLSMDGGGVRGLVLAIQLAELEDRTGLRVCDMFDLICGTSTGGLLALALGIQKVPARACVQLYHQLAGSVFAKGKGETGAKR